MSYEFLTVEKDGFVATVTLNRPDNLNALSADLMHEICDVADSFEYDVDTRAVIFTGTGKHFSAGADLKDPKRAAMADRTMNERRRHTHLGQKMATKLQAISQITVAAINGVALGGGGVIVSALDFRIGADDCRVGYPEIDRGMNLSWFGLPLCLRLVGPSRAKRMVILGQMEDAETLLNWGFLDEVVPKDELMDAARKMADAYASKPPIPAQMIKRSANVLSGGIDQSLMHMDIDQFILTTMTNDYVEGVSSFMEKREPEFKGD